MDLDELYTPKKPAATFPRDLAPMSVEHMAEYKQELLDEIKRIETEIERKKKQRTLADSLFKK